VVVEMIRARFAPFEGFARFQWQEWARRIAR